MCELVKRLVGRANYPVIGTGVSPIAYIPCSYQKMVLFYLEYLGAVFC